MAAKGGIERPANQGNDDDGSGHVAITARVVLSGTSAARRGGDISVRPSSAQIWEIKRSLLHGRRASDYELDHIIPIGLGGAVLDRRNLQLQRLSGACNAHMKDELERQLSIMVCAGDATLTGAQHEIGTDWRAAYKKWIDSKGCGEE